MYLVPDGYMTQIITAPGREIDKMSVGQAAYAAEEN